eukprot:TRINITY_DN323_c0_g1_i1.p1 TRINITY_DN323_c0_g1~~TRINITY_DN323_c0_g1_i1.p1  ORF type:complete len:334 (-),score=57.05 TRINITY_DN323_c0_g1_i1:132-1133(-)
MRQSVLCVALLVCLSAVLCAPLVPVTDVNDYSVRGPYAVTLTTDSVTVDAGRTYCSGNQCTIGLDVFVPSGSGVFPLAVFSTGFNIDPSRYRQTQEHLASWGYVVVALRLNDGLVNDIKHRTKALFVTEVINWVVDKSKTPGHFLNGKVSTSRVFLFGHSVGGKSSMLAASYEVGRVVGVYAIDPVDCEPGCVTPESKPCEYTDEYPSAAARANLLSSGSVVLLGGEVSGDSRLGPACAPRKCDHLTFFSNSPTGSWDIEFLKTGHNQFLDTPPNPDACTTGSQTSSVILSMTRAWVVAWAEKTVRGIDTSDYYGGRYMQSQIGAGNVRVRSN